ncbi:MAG: DUF835 domain-containing protein [Thermoplasmata archaeon]
MTEQRQPQSAEGKSAFKIKKVKKVKKVKQPEELKENEKVSNELQGISQELQAMNEEIPAEQNITQSHEENGEVAAKQISLLDARIRELETFGIDVSYGKSMLIQSAMALQMQNYTDALNAANAGIEIMETTALDKGRELLASAERILSDLLDAFGNFEEASQLSKSISEVNNQLDAKNFQEALDNAIKVKGLAVMLQNTKINEAIEELELQTSYLAEMRFDLATNAQAASLIKGAKNAKENGDYRSALSYLKQSREIISALSEKFIREVFSMLKPVLPELDELTSIELIDGTELPVANVKAKLASIANALSTQNYTDALKDATELWKWMKVYVWRKKVNAQIMSAEKVIADREARGLDIPQAKKMLAEAKRRLSIGDFEKAFTYAVNAEENAKIYDGLSSTELNMEHAQPLIHREKQQKQEQKDKERASKFSPEIVNEIKPGCSYLITSDFGMELVKHYVHDGDDALVIARNFSADEKKLISDFKISSIRLTTVSGKSESKASIGIPVGIIGLGGTSGLLSQGEEVQMNPQNLQGIASQIKEQIRSSEKCVILIRDLDYLITQNDFKATLRTLQEIVEHISISNAKLIVEAEPTMIDEKEIKLLERELKRL